MAGPTPAQVIAQLQADVATLKNQVAGLTNTVQSLASQVATHASRLPTDDEANLLNFLTTKDQTLEDIPRGVFVGQLLAYFPVPSVQLAALNSLSKEEIGVLNRLANDKLYVRIVSYKGYALDNYYGRCDDGDGDRTVQFQHNNPSNVCLKMKLELV